MIDRARDGWMYGRVSAEHWWIDLGPIYLPAAILAVALRSAIRSAPA
jgi:hypothetical protein